MAYGIMFLVVAVLLMGMTLSVISLVACVKTPDPDRAGGYGFLTFAIFVGTLIASYQILNNFSHFLR